MQISIILKGKILPGKQENLRTVVKTLQQQVLLEKGCEEYAFYIDGDQFVMVERWSDQAALDLHGQTPHFSELVPKMKALVEGGTFSAEFIQSSDRRTVTL